MKQHGKWRWVWSVLDKETRFWIASHISTERAVSDAREPFRKAKETARKQPKVVVSDGLRSYQKAFKKEFFTLRGPRTEHIRKPRFIDQANNNIVERLNGTIREREKVTRNLKEQSSVIIEGYRNYYNLIRPHQSLNGKTPSEQAGLELKLEKNKWLSLIRKGANESQNTQSHYNEKHFQKPIRN